MRMRRYFFLLMMLGTMVLCTIAVGNVTPAATQATDTLAAIRARGCLIIGTDPTYPPFEEKNAATGEYEGFDIDLANQIALSLGVGLQVEESEWDPIIPNLKQSKFDVILSAMTITEAREVEVDFTRWYYKSAQAILVMNANPKNIVTEADLNQTLTIGVQAGTTSDLWVQDHLNASLVTLNTYDTILLAIQALKNGQVDVVLGDHAVLAQEQLESGLTKVVDTYSPEDFGIACRDGDDNLRNAINDALDALLGSDESHPAPTDLYNIMYYKWFDSNAADIGYTGTATTGTIPSAAQGCTPAPGFEVFVAMLVIMVLPVVKRFKKDRK
ncbi:MAG: transporter substrate-binding domain-containing protein [Candidatus Hodarchaeota archaeon]